MSPIADRIRNDSIAARKARDSVAAGLLGTVLGEITTREKNFSPARPLTDEEVVAVVRKFLKGVEETATVLANSGRTEDIAKNAREKAILEAYLPTQMTEDEIEAFAQAKKAEGLNMGGIMATLKAERAGQYDGKLASAVVKRVLA